LIGGLGSLLCCGLAVAQKLALPTSVAFWDKSLNVRAGFGYKDNVLLSATDPIDSAFFQSGIEVSLWRLPREGWEFSFYLDGTDWRYFASPHFRIDTNLPPEELAQAQAARKQLEHDFGDEQFVTVLAQVKRRLAETWTAAASVQYFYQNQVFDATDSLGAFATVKAQGHGLAARPSLRRDLPRNLWVELEGEAGRQFLASPLDNEWNGGPKLTLGRSYGRRSELTGSFRSDVRYFDTRRQFDSDGFAIPDTHLRFWQHTAELRWQHHWDQDRRWRTTTRLTYAWNEDNGPGFYDYARYRFSAQVRYRTRGWELSAQARVSHYDFDVQQVALPGDEPGSVRGFAPRRKTDFEFSLRGERSLTRSLKIFGEFAHDRSDSNQTFNNYFANSVLLGFDWAF
jgi:hypothetical protein